MAMIIHREQAGVVCSGLELPLQGLLGLLLLAAAACASAPVARAPSPDQPPLPRSSIVAVLAHRGELELSDEQAAALEQADADLQAQFARLRAEGGVPAPAPGGLRGSVHGGPPSSGQGGQAAPGFGMSAGPDGFQLAPTGTGHGGAPRAGAAPEMAGTPPADGAKPPARRQDPVKVQEALDAGLDDADTRAFLRAEAVLTPAQRDRAREIASGYREQLFERREQQRGR